MEPPIALEQPNVPDELLGKELALYYADPLGFVMAAYPWKQAGTELGHEEGPDENQKQLLIDLGKEVAARARNGTDPVMPILMTATSGHGTGDAPWALGSPTGPGRAAEGADAQGLTESPSGPIASAHPSLSSTRATQTSVKGPNDETTQECTRQFTGQPSQQEPEGLACSPHSH